jgi:hypothetical protein
MVKFTFNDTGFKTLTSELKTVSRTVMPQLAAEFVKLTPYKSGNARNHTTLKGNTITANYPYAAVLDAGRGYRAGQMRGSEQAPEGMSKPVREAAQVIIPAAIAKIARR